MQNEKQLNCNNEENYREWKKYMFGFESGHYPTWFQKKVREIHQKEGGTKETVENMLPNFFDHSGSMQNGTIMSTEPYAVEDFNQVVNWAEKHGFFFSIHKIRIEDNSRYSIQFVEEK